MVRRHPFPANHAIIGQDKRFQMTISWELTHVTIHRLPLPPTAQPPPTPSGADKVTWLSSHSK